MSKLSVRIADFMSLQKFQYEDKSLTCFVFIYQKLKKDIISIRIAISAFFPDNMDIQI